jgi:hypothetical protein
MPIETATIAFIEIAAIQLTASASLFAHPMWIIAIDRAVWDAID